MSEEIQEQQQQQETQTATEQAVNTENAAPGTETETKPEKTFTQKELDEIVTKRIERERETVSKKATQEARDAYIAEQGFTWNGKEIKTEAEYKQALQEQELAEKLKARDLPDDVVTELVESKRFREEYKQTKAQAEEVEKRNKDFTAFVEAFPGVDSKSIPQEVWAEVNAGKSLVDAYTRYDNAQLRQKLAKYETTTEAKQKAAELAAASTGSATGAGASTAQPFYTPEQVSKMSLEETNKNWAAIMESQKRWS